MRYVMLTAAILLVVVAVREAPSSLLGGLPTMPSADLGLHAGRDAADGDRALYLDALRKARQAGSVSGVLAAVEGLAALGDQEAVASGMGVAESLAAGDPEAQADLRDASRRFADLLAH